jgi:hypothetical protein
VSYEDAICYSTDQVQNALFITDAHRTMHGGEMAQMKVAVPFEAVSSYCLTVLGIEALQALEVID